MLIGIRILSRRTVLFSVCVYFRPIILRIGDLRGLCSVRSRTSRYAYHIIFAVLRYTSLFSPKQSANICHLYASRHRQHMFISNCVNQRNALSMQHKVFFIVFKMNISRGHVLSSCCVKLATCLLTRHFNF